MKKNVILALTILLTPFLNGCWDSIEPESMVYGNGIGVDYKNGQYHFYTQIINLGKIAKSESAGGVEQIQEEVGHASGPDVDQALKNLYKSTQRRIYWGHIKFVVLTEEALRKSSLRQLIDLLNRYREFRYRIFVVSTKEPLNKILLSPPELEMSTALTKLSEPMSNFNQDSVIPPMNMRELQIGLNEPVNQAIIPMISIVDEKWESREKKRIALKYNGAAIMTGNQLKGFITNKDMLGFRWILEESKRMEIFVGKNGKPAALIVVEHPKASIKPIVRNERVTFDITIKAPGTLTEMDQEVNESYLIQEIKKSIQNDIKRTYEKGLKINADVYKLSEILYRKNIKVWKKIEHKGRIPLQRNSIVLHVKTEITNSGKTQNTPSL